MAFLARDGGQVYYEDYGSGDAAVVLVHGWGATMRCWDYTVPALRASGHRVVLLDHRGCGQTDKDFSDLGIEAIAADVVALVETLGISKVVLNGWSLGGAVVVSAAEKLGEGCIGLVLSCGATPAYLQKPDYPHGGTEEAMEATVAALTGDRVNFLNTLAKGVCAADVGADVEQWIAAAFLQTSPMAFTTIAELGPLDQREVLSSLSMPIVSFVGAHDAIVDPNVCRSVPDYNSGARVVEFEQSGHAPFVEEAEKYNQELLDFVTSCQ